MHHLPRWCADDDKNTQYVGQYLLHIEKDLSGIWIKWIQKKPKYLRRKMGEITPTNIYVDGEEHLEVISFRYLGSVVNGNNRIDEEIKERTSANNKT